MDKAKLIDAVRESPCLWRVSDSSYKDFKAKDSAWKEVANQVCFNLYSVYALNLLSKLEH